MLDFVESHVLKSSPHRNLSLAVRRSPAQQGGCYYFQLDLLTRLTLEDRFDQATMTLRQDELVALVQLARSLLPIAIVERVFGDKK